MTILGINDMKAFALPPGVDGGELSKYMLSDGTSYEEIVNDIAVGLQEAGTMLATDPQYGGMVSFTEELAFEYPNGSATTGMEERTEFRGANPRRGSTVGHMLPLTGFDRSLSWTWDFLDAARRIQLDTDINDALYDVKDEFQRRVLTRFFSDTENVIATSGRDMPLANGSANVAYTPPAYNGKTFASSHTHFARVAAGSRADGIKAGVLSLQEHGINGPYLGIVPEAQVSTYEGLSNFIKPERNLSDFRGATDLTRGAINEEVFFGALEDTYGVIYLWKTPRIATDHLGLYKLYGANDPRNPVAVRFNPRRGRGPILLSGGSFRQYPLENAMIVHDYGVGVSGAGRLARLNGYCIYFNSSGNYVAPTVA